MNLFDSIESAKDKSVIEPIGNEATQPMAVAMSVDERERLKKAMKLHYGSGALASNYSDFFIHLIEKYLDENTNS